MSSPRIILLEFNELSPVLLREFMDAGQLPNFRRFYLESTVFTTDAHAEGQFLEPWVQWPTVHSGLGYAEHGVVKLGEGRRIATPSVAALAAAANIGVGVFGSMNQNYDALPGFVVPDPWDPVGKTHPAFLQPFFDTVAGQVQESAKHGSSSPTDFAKLGWFLLRHGLSATTARMAVAQLAAERRDPGVKWRRGMLLDSIQYDVFRWLCRRMDIGFATFFSNSTAHLMHYFWRDMTPEAFDVKPPVENHPSLRASVLDGYKAMDALIGRFERDFRETRFVFVTALSQQPWTDTVKCTFRPINFGAFLRFAGIDTAKVEVKPVMAEQFRIVSDSPAVLEDAETELRAMRVGDDALMAIRREDDALFVGCAVTDPSYLSRSVTHNGESRRFDALLHMVGTMRSGKHHPDGCLWVRSGTHRVFEEKVPLERVAPTVLSQLGVPVPEFMKGEPLPL
ncbi:MAG TPA: hypothetical protein VMZ22_08265 [Acidimicrobiales bacterium]|nr:hypothetical protein [Acidimicrobiales bacterium]